MLRPTKLDYLLADASEWDDQLRSNAVSYLMNRCSVIHVMALCNAVGQEQLSSRVFWAKRDRLTDLTHLISPQELLTAWNEIRGMDAGKVEYLAIFGRKAA
jgi:hypothetical protein